MERKIWKEAEGKSMVTSIARQSVIIKCNMKKSVSDDFKLQTK